MTTTRDTDTGRDDSEAPHPDAEEKPDSPGDVSGPGWKYTAGNAFREFTDDQCTDLAAALVYYTVLALFPAIIAALSLLGLFGQGQATITAVTDILEQTAGKTIAETLTPVIESLSTSSGAGVAFFVGLAGALWSASGYVTAFSRAMNRVYEIGEGRPFWKLRPVMLLITLVALVLVVVAALILVASGPVATAIGNTIGLGSTAVLVWRIAKWPVLLAIIIFVVAVLYYATPNVKQPKFRWVSPGALVAIGVWILASVAFGFYVSNFGSYNATYGSLAGVIVFLLWLWITNLALLFGAEVQAELERSRQLLGGIEAEEDLQLPPRDTAKIDKSEAKEKKSIAKGRALRMSEGKTSDPDEVSDDSDDSDRNRETRESGTEEDHSGQEDHLDREHSDRDRSDRSHSGRHRSDRTGERSESSAQSRSRSGDRQVKVAEKDEGRWSDRKQGLPGMVGRFRGKNRS